jgi:hypothetical protein
VTLVFTIVNKLRNQLGLPKDATPILEKSGIYELTYETCNAVYVGQTRRTVIKRYKVPVQNPTNARIGMASVYSKTGSKD